ncbi:MAG TPA: STY4851/ECs_5259 family protein [Candidatus Competibacteraceae bacterium]|nr:STY4851/ECs_5259 family protein [Candidatus Competibacteraceae bacterium]
MTLPKHADPKNWLQKFLFTHTRQTLADGRPLYAYKMRDAAYADLKSHFHQILLLDSRGKLALRFAPIFCLYAAETFSREHAEGPWTWDTIFKPLGLETPSQSLMADWVEKGLNWWRRPPALRNAGGNRLFLVTIACEGGLPLRLLQRENTHLTHFFRTVLDHYCRNGQGGVDAAKRFAQQQVLYLPRSLRHDPVFHLAATLIAKIGELQAHIGTATDPIAALDAKVRDWRRDLPLRLEDQIAETLLTGLVRRAGELAQEATARLRWRGQLRETATGWRVEKRLELPERLTRDQISEWIGSPKPDQPRWRLLLHTPGGVEVVAWLTLIQGAGSADHHYRREWLRPGGVKLTGAAVGQFHRVSLHDGQKDYPLTVRDGEAWGDSPWVFVERGAAEEREWLTEGSARTRAESAWVLAEPELTPCTVNGACNSVVTVAELGRILYVISGEVELMTPQQDRYRIRCQAETESDETFVVIGETVPQALQQRPLHRGLPCLQAVDPKGRRQPATGRLQWRFVGDAAPWRESYEAAHGRIWLRLVNANGVERWRRQGDVVSRHFQIAADIGTGNQAGVVRLTGLAGAEIQPGADCPASVTINSTADQARIVCLSVSGVAPFLTLLLQWPGSQPIPLTLPYPQRGALFQLAGRPLLNDDWIALDRLGGLQLFIQDPAGGCRFWLESELIAGPNADVPLSRQGFRERLPPLAQGRIELSFFAWQERIASLLASSGDLEAQARLTIKTAQGMRLTQIQVARFDTVIEPDRETGRVRITTDSLTRLGADWQTRIRIAMIRLWMPATTPVALGDPDATGTWVIPTDLEPGPWWIVARDGDWARFRPLLWTVAASENAIASADSALVTAIWAADREQREQQLNLLLTELGQDPDHSDWPLLFDYVRLAREFPPSALDVLRLLIQHPRTLALALLKANEDTFASVWALSKQTPFLWMLVSVNDWRNAAVACFSGLQTALAEIDTSGEIVFSLFQQFRERASSTHRDYWRSLCDWLQEQLFPNRPLHGSSELKIARCLPDFIEQQIASAEQELMGRHDAEEQWPEGNEVISRLSLITAKYHYKHLDRFYRPVRCAPFVAAHISLKGIAPAESLVYQLRLLRSFDSEWFDGVYAIALTLGLATLPMES